MQPSSLTIMQKYDDTSTVEEVIELPAEIKERVNKASLLVIKH